MCVCVCVCVLTKIYIAVKYIFPMVKYECLYVWGDVDVHRNFSILKDGKCTNFIWTMNVFLLAVCLPISAACLKLWDRKVSMRESCQAEREIERGGSQKREIYRSLVTWPAPNVRFIFAQDKVSLWFQTRGSSWRHRHVTTLANQVPETIYFILAPYYFSFRNKWVLDPIFPEFSLHVLKGNY